MRTPIIAGNWKMNTNVEQAAALVRDMTDKLVKIQGVEKVFCPPFISLTTVGELIKKSDIKLGAQNMYFEEKGAYTGEIAPMMLAGLCEYVILGHSERRQYFGETDEIVNKKIHAAFKAGLKPIMCVGERLEENEAGKTEEVVTRQVKGGLANVKSPQGIVIAYEPVWAIGTGKAATGDQANKVMGLIRRIAAQSLGEQAAKDMRIQYGGSVTGANIAEFISQPEIDGALVGGASLKAADFVEIVRQTGEIKNR
jgi:triosephosphate isomerase